MQSHAGTGKYPDELRERAVKMVLKIRAREGKGRGELSREGRQLGIHPEALRGWVKQARIDGGMRPGMSTGDAARIAVLEREIVSCSAPMRYEAALPPGAVQMVAYGQAIDAFGAILSRSSVRATYVTSLAATLSNNRPQPDSPSHQRQPGRFSHRTASLLAEDGVHDLRALGERGPDLVPADQLRGGRSIVPGEQRDALHRDAAG